MCACIYPGRNEVIMKRNITMKKIRIIVSIVLVLVLAGCKKDGTVDPAAANMPVIANTQNAFAFDLVATAYTSNAVYPLSFSTDSLSCALTITGQTAGNGSLRIVDSTSSTVYSDSTLSNKIVALTQTGKGIPKNITLEFNNYTGIINFALSRSNKHS
jgi:serine protease inhibitor